MNKALEATQAHFESSCSKTPEYLAWHRMFKRRFTAFLTMNGMGNVVIGKPNHFDMSGFFTNNANGQIWYFSISDLRWSKGSMLVRTVQGYKDYTGGVNRYLPMAQGVEAFTREFYRTVVGDSVAK